MLKTQYENISFCNIAEAEIRIGELLAETPRAQGGQPYQKTSTGTHRELVEPTLSELGLTKREASNAELLASLSEEKQEAIISGKLTRTKLSTHKERS